MTSIKNSAYQYLPTFKLSSILSVPAQIVGNGLVTLSNTINQVSQTIAPTVQTSNPIFSQPVQAANETNNKIVSSTSNIINNVGTTLATNIQPISTTQQTGISNNPNTIADVATNTTTAKTQTLLGSNQSNSVNSIQLDGQTSYKVSDATYQKVKELYEKFLTLPSMQINNLWRPIYTAIKDDLKANNNEVDQGTKNWLKVAEAVAIADPQSFLYQYVRLGTGKSLAEKGIQITDPQFYQASNVLIKTLAENFLYGVKNANGDVVVPQGYLPSANGQYGLVRMDATQALENLGGVLGDWTGITPFSLLDHYLGVDTSEFNGGASRSVSWYLELLGDVVVANLKAGASLPNVIEQITSEGFNFLGQFINGEVFHGGFSSKDQLMNTVTQIAYAYAGDLAGPVAIATNIFKADTNIISTVLPWGTTLDGKDGNDVINGGTGNDKLYGGKGDDLLFGGWGNDVLDGGTGVNVLVGGRGSDTYYVQSEFDFVLEHAYQGTDTVISTAKNFYLTKNIENLTLAGSDHINGTGNAEDNIIKGNAGNNQLYGNAGNDVLEANGGLYNLLNGGVGNDQLIGGYGDETYEFYLGFGQDTIQEKGGHDTILFGNGISIDDLLIADSGKDRIISIKGTKDQITIRDWSAGAEHQVESIHFNNHDRLDLQTLQYQQNFYA